MKVSEVTYYKVSSLQQLKENPRTITKADFEKLVDSIKINGFWKHRPLAIKEQNGKFIVLAGNQRLKVAKQLKLKEVPGVLYSELTEQEEKEIILRDNINNGDWDLSILESVNFSDVDFDFIGLDEVEKDVKRKERKQSKDKNDIDIDNEGADKNTDNFQSQMLGDVLFESNNAFEIPNLLLDKQAGKLELPLSPWGANARIRKDVTTYHFYVDDYRFEKLFKNPYDLLASGCKAIVEPNCSLHDQTPIAYGLHLIYKKRWISRYLQESGIKVYADLNVSYKFKEYNKMGIPQGYNAFFTRGLDGWIESLKIDLQTAKEISGKDFPNLCVYGGGEDIKRFCQKNSLLYVTDFINAKK